MLNDDAKMVINFLEECRTQLTIKDELHSKTEEMYSTLYLLQDMIKGDEVKSKTFIKLESLINDVLTLTKDTYFEYGDNFAQVRENNFINNLQEAE